MIRSAAVLAALILFASSMFAQPGQGPRQRNRPLPSRQAIFEELKLTEQQQTELRKLRFGFQKSQEQIRSKIRVTRLERREMFLADKLDRSGIEKATKAISGLQEQARMNHLDHLFAVNALLTPEQQKIWKRHMAQVGMEFRMQMREMRGNARGPGGRGMGLMEMGSDDDTED